jgi:hypothetical protein
MRKIPITAMGPVKSFLRLSGDRKVAQVVQYMELLEPPLPLPDLSHSTSNSQTAQFDVKCNPRPLSRSTAPSFFNSQHT